MKLFLCLFFVSISGFLLLSGCEGGKSRPRMECAAGEYEERGQCVANSTECKSTQTLINGVCKNTPTCEQGFHLEGEKCVASTLSIEVLSNNSCYYPQNGTTRIILQYITRDEAGAAIDPVLNNLNQPTALNNALLVDGKQSDVESILEQDSELLNSDLVMSMVLDSSLSMVTHTPPAFAPMKQAAIDVLTNTQNAWNIGESNFYWELAWFNSVIYRPKPNNAGEKWSISDITHIPAPVERDYTALYKAVDHMIGVHADLYTQGLAAGSRDQHVMIVFSDGANNHSYFDNATFSEEGNNADNMVFWDGFGLAPVPNLTDIRDPSTIAPNLRIHVIGMGDKVDEAELKAIAANSNGQYFYGSDATTLGEVFSQVQRELVTQQTYGVETPLQPGEYSFELRSERISDGSVASYTWTQDAGDSLPTCAP